MPKLQSEEIQPLDGDRSLHKQAVTLFNPRADAWDIHLAWSGYVIVGRTPVGRALVAAFDLNHDRRLRIREAEEHFGFFPP